MIAELPGLSTGKLRRSIDLVDILYIISIE